MNDYADLKAIAEACIGIVPQVTINPQSTDCSTQNKNYADLVLAATPEVILGLLDDLKSTSDRLHEVATACATAEQEREALKIELANAKEKIGILREGGEVLEKGGALIGAELRVLQAENAELRKDSARLDRLDLECETYGTDVPEGNRWVLDGPFATARDAIDALPAIPTTESDYDLAN